MSAISQSRLKEVLEYDPLTGAFTWRKTRGRAAAGSVAGCVNHSGYCMIRVDGYAYYAHRLAWLYTYGEFPDGLIDHINRDKTDNRLSNLRVCSNMENGQNAKISSANKSGTTGVFFNASRQKWMAQIMVARKNVHLGFYESIEDAIRVRKEAEARLHPFKVTFDQRIEEEVND